jgi:hypothetical protein
VPYLFNKFACGDSRLPHTDRHGRIFSLVSTGSRALTKLLCSTHSGVTCHSLLPTPKAADFEGFGYRPATSVCNDGRQDEHRRQSGLPSQAGTVIKPDHILPRYMEPVLEKAGLRRFRFHDLRHKFGNLLIQGGASLAYVKDQMGHSSIQITVDTYGISSRERTSRGWTGWIRKQLRTNPHQVQNEAEEKRVEVLENTWLPPRDSNPDMLIQSQLSCR